MTTTIPSPCADVCRLDGATGFCIGCLRTREEIKGWKNMTDDLRVQVIVQRAQREVTAKAQIHGPRMPCGATSPAHIASMASTASTANVATASRAAHTPQTEGAANA